MGVKVIWLGDEVVADFDKIFKKRLNRAGREWVRKAQKGLNRRKNRKGESPSKKNQFPAQVTSHLKINITAEPARRLFGGFGRLSKLVGTNVPYGKWLELGTDPYVIKPKKKKALSFTVGGNKIIAKKINHPGIKKRPWMTLTNRLMRKRIIQILSAKVR